MAKRAVDKVQAMSLAEVCIQLGEDTQRRVWLPALKTASGELVYNRYDGCASKLEKHAADARELEAHVLAEIDRLRSIKFHLVTRVRGILFTAGVCDVIFSYLPWFGVTKLTGEQTATVQLLDDTRNELNKHEERIGQLEAQIKRFERVFSNEALLTRLFSGANA